MPCAADLCWCSDLCGHDDAIATGVDQGSIGDSNRGTKRPSGRGFRKKSSSTQLLERYDIEAFGDDEVHEADLTQYMMLRVGPLTMRTTLGAANCFGEFGGTLDSRCL